jgi:hypothetical protein
MVTWASPEGQPRGSFHWEVWGNKASINRIAPNTIATLKGCHHIPTWIGMMRMNGLSHLQAVTSEHLEKGARCHVFICVHEYHKSIACLPPKE